MVRRPQEAQPGGFVTGEALRCSWELLSHPSALNLTRTPWEPSCAQSPHPGFTPLGAGCAQTRCSAPGTEAAGGTGHAVTAKTWGEVTGNYLEASEFQITGMSIL